MTENKLDKNYWEERYRQSQTGWDIGEPSTPLKQFIDQLTDTSLRILVPGCGNAWEVAYLWEQGFHNTYLLDIAEAPVEAFKARHPEVPADHCLLGDFFAHESCYDLVLEQTFFCALDPALRAAYVQQMSKVIKPGGLLAGLLFNCSFEAAGPPFGGSKAEYLELFSPYFEILSMETAPDSIGPRAGRELFIRLSRK